MITLTECKKNDKLDKVKEAIKSDTVKVDDARVKITEMQLDAIQKLATNKNEVFSHIDKVETIDINKAYVFADNPLPSLNDRLKRLDIDFQVQLPILTSYLDRMLELRHCTDRKRVSEYIEAIQAVSPKLSIQERPEQSRGILGGRLL